MPFLVAFLACLLAAIPARADWLRLRGTHTELLTDAGEKEGRRALNRLEQIRAIMPSSGVDSDRELRVVLFDSEKEFREYAPGETTAGLYQSGLERDYIVTYAGGELPRVVTHEFVHFLLNQTPAPLPHWFEEGTAELYSNAQINSKRVRIGKELEAHMDLLLARPWLTAVQLTAERPVLPEKEQDIEQAENMFYAESWALVHMLNLSPNYRDHMPQFVMLLAAGHRGIGGIPHGVRAGFRARPGRPARLSEEDSQRQARYSATRSVCRGAARAPIGSCRRPAACGPRSAPRTGAEGARLVRADRKGASGFGRGASRVGDARHDPESPGRRPQVSRESHPAR